MHERLQKSGKREERKGETQKYDVVRKEHVQFILTQDSTIHLGLLTALHKCILGTQVV